MKILMISSDASIGSKEMIDATAPFRKVLYSLAEKIDQVYVICCTRDPAARPWTDNNIHVYPILSKPLFAFMIKACLTGSKIARANKIDVISSQDVLRCGIPAWLLKVRHRLPVIMELHGHYLGNPRWVKKGLSFWVGNLVGKWILKKGDLVRVTSQEIKKHTAAEGISESDMFYLPHRTDVNLFKPGIDTTALRDHLGLFGKQVVLFIGRLSWEKLPGDAVKAFALARERLKGLHLILIGSGDLDKNVDEIIDEIGVRDFVTKIGGVPNNELPVYFNLADVFILTSKFEGRPRVVQEALACGVPVVATAVSGVTEMIEPGHTGFLAHVGDTESLAQGIIKIVSDSTVRAQMSKACRQFMLGDFTWERGMAGMVEMYEIATRKNIRFEPGEKHDN